MLCETTSIQSEIWRVFRAAAVPLTPSFHYGTGIHNRNFIQVSWRWIASQIGIYGFVVRSSEYEKRPECKLTCDLSFTTQYANVQVKLQSFRVTLRHILLWNEIPYPQ
jgi:hypothetical protein